jgi:O-antigen ligase
VAAPRSGLDRATSGRFDLISNGLRIAADHPLAGVGVGGFERAYAERVEQPGGVKVRASHTTPVTVVAEGGVVGLALYAWLLAAAALLAFRRTVRGTPVFRIAAVVAGVELAAIFVHSLAYDAFFEDPFVWAFFALAALAARATATGASAVRPSA